MNSSVKRWLACIGLVAVAAVAVPVSAQPPYPNKPIRLIVPFAAGGALDALARAVAPKLSESLGVQVLVDNKGGAGGGIAMAALTKSAPDGYTIGLGHSGTHSINPHLYAKAQYDALTGFTPITPLVSYVNVLVCNPEIPAKTVGELVAYAKANPSKVAFGSGGTGTTSHLSAELLKVVTGAPIVHVPYKGGGPAMTDVMGGTIACMFDLLVTGLPPARAGKTRALAVTSAKRSRHAADVPTMAESGVKGYEEAGSDLWIGVFAPAATPKPIVDRLYSELVKAVKAPDVAERVRLQAFDVWTLSPDEFPAFLRADNARWGTVVKFSGAKVE
jgi:tripartite-type tricarboxylate transporter receptor subunit TctC